MEKREDYNETEVSNSLTRRKKRAVLDALYRGAYPAAEGSDIGADAGRRSMADSKAADNGNVAHETDGIDGILGNDLPTSVGGVYRLSASAQEFTPSGGVNSSVLHGNEDGSPDDATWPFDDDAELHEQVQLEAEMLQLMSESFSDCSPECLQIALAKSDWNLERASVAILSALQAVDPDRPSKPCRHLLSGECLRSDCTFSHDFASTTCRFWLHGQCVHASACVFRHDLDVPNGGVDDDADADANAATAFETLADSHGPGYSAASDELGVDNFPSLASNDSSRASALAGRQSVRSPAYDSLTAKSMADPPWPPRTSADVAPAVRAEAVPSRTPSQGMEGNALLSMAAATAPRKGNTASGGRKRGRGRKTRFTAVSIQTLMRGAPDGGNNSPDAEGDHGFGGAVHQAPPRPAGAAPSSAAAEVATRATGDRQASAAATRTWSGVSFADVVGTGNVFDSGSDRRALAARDVWGTASGSAPVRPTPGAWVSTGDAVSSQYQDARQEAAELARARNKLFTSATEAFRRGNGLAARDLARRGREINDKMKKKHRQAAAHIFASRNPGEQVLQRKTIDLHGLHVAEAVEVLEVQMAALVSRHVEDVKVLAGTGHHSKGPTSKARLIPAVEHFCQSRGLLYRRVPDKGTGHVGVIEVKLTGWAETGHETQLRDAPNRGFEGPSPNHVAPPQPIIIR